MEKVALMPGIAAYVYTKSGNLSSYGWCNAWGGGRGGSGFALPAAILQLHWLLWKEAVFIDWLGGARGPAGSQCGAGVKVQRDFNKAK